MNRHLFPDAKIISDWDILENAPLCSLTTWRVGGCVDYLVCPKNHTMVGEVLKRAAQSGMLLSVLGGGSNTLVSDKPLHQILLHTSSMSAFSVTEDHPTVLVCCEAGVSLRSLFAYTVRNQLSGLEFAVGIPGSIGGALIGNAGVADQAIGESVEWIETAHEDGSLRRWEREELNWSYRYCSLSQIQGAVIVRCALKFHKGEPAMIRGKVAQHAAKKRRQPLAQKTAGCVFKNPPNDSAGRLLELSGCKGLSLGGAQISTIHANFIENRGNASAWDIFSLAENSRKRVFEKLGVLMEYEVKFIGDFTTED